MVQYNRIELLNHPVCKKYLAMKWWVFRRTWPMTHIYFYRFIHPSPAPVNLLPWPLVHGVLCFVHRVAYGSIAHVLNMFLYLLGLLPLTHLIVTLRPSVNTSDTGEHNIIMVPVSFTEVLMAVVMSNNDSDSIMRKLWLKTNDLSFKLLEKCIFTNVPFKVRLNICFTATCVLVLLHGDGIGYEYLLDRKGSGADITAGTVLLWKCHYLT